MAFVHLHTHSEYSLLDGANRIPELVTHVKKLGMDSLAVTDHGNMHAAWTFYEAAKAQKIRPILGFEAYLAFGPRQAREKPASAPSAYSHLVLLARNQEGYRNLVRLTSIGYTEGFYRRPRIDKEVLAKYIRGSRLSGGMPLGRGGAVPPAGSLRRGSAKPPNGSPRPSGGTTSGWRSRSTASPRKRSSPRACWSWAGSWACGVVATNDAHYLRREDAEATTCCWRSAPEATSTIPSGSASPAQESYVKSEAEMRQLFPDQLDAVANTQVVADRFEFDFEKRYFVPSFPRPAEFDSDEALLAAPAPPPGPRRATARPFPTAVQPAARL